MHLICSTEASCLDDTLQTLFNVLVFATLLIMCLIECTLLEAFYLLNPLVLCGDPNDLPRVPCLECI